MPGGRRPPWAASPRPRPPGGPRGVHAISRLCDSSLSSVATAGLAFFAYIQSRDMKEFLRIAKESADAAFISAKATRRSVKLAKTQVHVLERAYLAVGPTNIRLTKSAHEHDGRIDGP